MAQSVEIPGNKSAFHSKRQFTSISPSTSFKDNLINPEKMSLQWTLVAGFLYAEIALLVFLLIPYISDSFWNTVFRINFIRKLERQFIYYFYCLVSVLVLCFLDSIREMTKYSSREDIAKEVISVQFYTKDANETQFLTLYFK